MTNAYRSFVVLDRDVNEEVLAAGDDEHADRLGHLADPVAEALDVAPRGRADADGDEGLHATADRGQVEVEDGAAA